MMGSRTRTIRQFTRRELLGFCGRAALGFPLLEISSCYPALAGAQAGHEYQRTDDQLLEEIERTAFQFFWNEANSVTGLVKDRALANGRDDRTVASIAATGFGLTALSIADQRGYESSAKLKSRVRATLEFLLDSRRPSVNGFFYHFMDMRTGERAYNCELSPIDTAILLCGVLAVREHFRDKHIASLATKIYERVNWPWMLNGGSTFAMAWTPERGFTRARWDTYNELMMLYLLALGSPTHPISPESWSAWNRPVIQYQGISYISGAAPLFVHQYSHAWFDFRSKKDSYADYFQNSVKATQAHKLFCISLAPRFPAYSDDLWGITASDSPHGYVAWGGPPAEGPIDGSVVPAAAAGSIPFLTDETLKVLRTIRSNYPSAWKGYGFVDAFNPLSRWINPDVIGIDVGISMLMAENARTGFVWQTFMSNPEARIAMTRAGFLKS